MSRLSERLKAAKGDLSIDDIAKRASREGGTIKRSTVAKYLRGEHGSNPPEETLAGLAAGLGLDVRELRELAGRPAGELGPYVPTPLSASLTTEQRKAIDDLIKAFVIEGGQKDAGNAEAEKSPVRSLDDRRRNKLIADAQQVDAAAAPDNPEDEE